jgi:hypothetical protein
MTPPHRACELTDDIRDFAAALAKPDRRMMTSAILDGMSTIRAWHRGLSPGDLARAARIAETELIAIEVGTRTPTAAALRRLAKTLRAHVDDLSA